MTRHTLCIVLGSALVFTGCEKKEAEKPAAPSTSKNDGVGGLLDAGKAAAGSSALKDAKDQAVAAATATLDGLAKQFDGLKLKGPTVPADSKTAFDAAIKDLDTQFAGAKAQIGSLKSAAADAWQKTNTDLQATLSKLGDSLKSALATYGK